MEEVGAARIQNSGLDSLSSSGPPQHPVSATASPRLNSRQTPIDRNGVSGSQAGSSGRATPRRLAQTQAISPSASGRHFHSDASVVLIGIRASGKRSLGLIAATALGWRFVTEDHYFQTVNGLSRQDYLKVYGSEQFHRQDIETSKRMLEENKHQCVVDCGLGSLTSGLQDYLKHYSRTNPVVFVVRDMSRIKHILNLDSRAAKLLESGNSTHRKCSNYEFYNLEDDSLIEGTDEPVDRTSPSYAFKLRNVQADFSSFVRFITGKKEMDATLLSPFALDIPVEARPYIHALFLTLSDFMRDIDIVSLESAGDLVEIHVGQANSNSASALSEMVARARRTLDMPILVSVSRNLIDSTTNDRYMAFLYHSLRLGVQYLSIDLELNDDQVEQIQHMRGHTRLVGTYHHTNSDGRGWKDPIMVNMYKRAIKLKLDMVRLLNTPKTRQENQTAMWFQEHLKEVEGPQIPCAVYNTGPLGATSQLVNPVLSPVTFPAIKEAGHVDEHSLQPTLTSKDIIRALFESYVFDPLQFFIVGANVSGSLSPAMHGAAYEKLGLKHNYSTKNISGWADIEEIAKDDALGGLSVVQPYKVKLVPYMNALSGHAKAIGAVNTLIPLRALFDSTTTSLDAQALSRNRAGRITGWFGDNTDFIGISNCVKRSLSPRNVIQPRTTSLVIGAGGMARAAVYALLQLGCKHVFVYNRTAVNTRALARHFNELTTKRTNGITSVRSQDHVKVIEKRTEPWPADYAPPTIVVSCVTHEVLEGNPGADFEMPESWLGSPSGGVVVEMAYMTKETPLIKQMKSVRRMTHKPWVLVDGIETLIEQAIGQFESMTGRKAPKRCMAEAAHASIRSNTSYLVDGEEFFA